MYFDDIDDNGHFSSEKEKYVHPLELLTPTLEVTIGCSYNNCSFCTMYKDFDFRVSYIDDIIRDLQELSAKNPFIERLCLLNGDPFVLSTEKLVQISELARKYLPYLKDITCYASIRNLTDKSVYELARLKKSGYTDLYIGLESACEASLLFMNKGFKPESAYDVLSKLTKAKIPYNVSIMLGMFGENTHFTDYNATFDLLKKYPPAMITVVPTCVMPSGTLANLSDIGDFSQLTERELLCEEIKFLTNLDVPDDCYFFGSHHFNFVQVSGFIKDKHEILAHLQDALHKTDEKILNSVLPRNYSY